jgi:hypothetical protein
VEQIVEDCDHFRIALDRFKSRYGLADSSRHDIKRTLNDIL